MAPTPVKLSAKRRSASSSSRPAPRLPPFRHARRWYRGWLIRGPSSPGFVGRYSLGRIGPLVLFDVLADFPDEFALALLLIRRGVGDLVQFEELPDLGGVVLAPTSGRQQA